MLLQISLLDLFYKSTHVCFSVGHETHVVALACDSWSFPFVMKLLWQLWLATAGVFFSGGGSCSTRMVPVRSRPRAPHPRRYLVLLLLQERVQSSGVCAEILFHPGISQLEALLSAARSHGLILLFVGTDCFPVLRAGSRELYNLFARLVDQAFTDRHRLVRALLP